MMAWDVWVNESAGFVGEKWSLVVAAVPITVVIAVLVFSVY